MAFAKRHWSLGILGAVVATSVGIPVGASARVIEVQTCDDLASSSRAVRYDVAADVDCGDARVQLSLADGGKLALGGHVVRGVDVRCTGDCQIVGPGTLDDGSVRSFGRVTVRRATISNSDGDGVVASGFDGKGRVTLIDATVSGHTGNGVSADRMAKLVRSTVTGNARHGVAIVEKDDCRRGRIRASSSFVVDNGFDGSCGADSMCADVAACEPREAALKQTACATSYELGSGVPGRNCRLCDRDHAE